MTRPATRGLVVLIALLAAVAPLAGTVAADDPEFEERIVRAAQDEVAAFAVSTGDAERATVRVGSEQVNFIVNATVTDADGDGAVVLQLDVEAAGNGDPDSYLSAAGDDEIESAEQETPEIRPPLAEGNYDLALYRDGEEVDIGTLVVTAPKTPEHRDGTSLDYEGERIVLSSAEGQVVRGETTLEPGSSVVVRIRSSGDSPFLKTVETTVAEDGTFEATVDMSDIAEGSDFQVSVRGDGSELASAEGQVGCEDDCPTTASTATTFAPTTATPSDGGFLESLGPLGAMALGAILAVVGVGVLLGVFRT